MAASLELSPTEAALQANCIALGIDPAEFDKVQDIADPPPLRKPQSRALEALGQPIKALRQDNCGRTAHVQLCENSHKSKCVAYCGTRTCLDCAERYSRDKIEQFRLTCAHIIRAGSRAGSGHPYRFTYLDIQFPEPTGGWQPEFIRSTLESVSRKMDDIAKHPFLVRWVYAAGINDSRSLVIRVLSTDNSPLSRDQLIAAWPEALVTAHTTLPIYSIFKFIEKLFTVVLPRGHVARAEMEVAMSGVRRLRTTGLIRLGDDPEMLVEDETPTDNSPHEESLEPPRHQHRGRRCPLCRGRIVARSRNFDIYTESGLMATLEMYPIDH